MVIDLKTQFIMVWIPPGAPGGGPFLAALVENFDGFEQAVALAAVTFQVPLNRSAAHGLVNMLFK